MVQTTLLGAPTAPRPDMATEGALGSLFQNVVLTLNLPDGPRPKTAIIVVHPAGNTTRHFTLVPFTEAGFASIGILSRFAGGDTYLSMEEVLLDVGGAVRFAREQGFEHVILFGYSGGASVMSYYQSQAEDPTVTSTPAGDPPDLTQAGLEPADALVLAGCHPGRAQILTEWMDPSLIDEHDPFATDPELDMYNSENGPPYSPDFQARYRGAQLDRNERITRWVWAKLRELGDRTDGARDLQFCVYRTNADIRTLDLAIDPNDRALGSYRGDPRLANLGGRGLASTSSLRSWLSQWSVSASNADGHKQASRISKPVLVGSMGADQGCFPSHTQGYFDAIQHDNKEQIYVPGARHFFDNQPDKLRELVSLIAAWLKKQGLDGS